MKGYLPPYVIYKLIFFLPDGRTETFYASGEQKMFMYEFYNYFLEEIAGLPNKKNVDFKFHFFANSPYTQHNEMSSMASSNGVGSISSSFRFNIPLMRKTEAHKAVGYIISFDPENTLKFNLITDDNKDIKKYIGSLNQ